MLALPLALLLCQEPAAPATTPPPRLIVHEWGTFLSVMGSDAVILDGVQHEEEGLPQFCHDRRQRGGFEGWLQKMETPVTYFYAPAALRAKVAVEFPAGVFTHWFPRVARTLPPLPPLDQKDAGGQKIVGPWQPERTPPLQNGLLDWSEIEILAPGDQKGERCVFPADLKQFTWGYARQVDANAVRSTLSGEYEKFLFYRGLGRFHGPLAVHSAPDGKCVARTQGRAARRLLLLQVQGDQGGYALVGDVAADQERALQFPAASLPLSRMVKEVHPLLARELVAEGLYPKEAEAMVNTWERQYFRTPGRRVLYVLDQDLTDALIPLHVEPRPSAIKRVMVARLECIAPEVEGEMVAWARDLAGAHQGRRDAAKQHFKALGRFTEPYLHRTAALVRNDAAAARAVRDLLAETVALQ